MIVAQPPLSQAEDSASALRAFLAERGLEALLDGPVIFEPEPLKGGQFQTARRYLPAHVARLQCPELTKAGYRRVIETVDGGFKVSLVEEDRLTMKRFAEHITSEEFVRGAR